MQQETSVVMGPAFAGTTLNYASRLLTSAALTSAR